ncbi:hypothetical protein AB0M36_13940 [Actinoplanes sp. NPDC051346]|uniref:hypothetical protein n=1 Tax=Actinoplanes sp. NPDC051346 TaxID=3155048 RepID=UPI00341BDB21
MKLGESWSGHTRRAISIARPALAHAEQHAGADPERDVDDLPAAESDLPTLARSAVRRNPVQTDDPDHLLARLAAALGRSGDMDRATGMTALIRDVDRRGETVTELVRTLAASGDLVRARALSTTAPNPPWRSQALLPLLPYLGDDTELADEVVAAIRYPHSQAHAWAMLAETAAAAGDTDRMRACAHRAEGYIDWLSDELSGRVVLALVRAALIDGDFVRARELAKRVPSTAPSDVRSELDQILGPDWRDDAESDPDDADEIWVCGWAWEHASQPMPAEPSPPTEDLDPQAALLLHHIGQADRETDRDVLLAWAAQARLLARAAPDRTAAGTHDAQVDKTALLIAATQAAAGAGEYEAAARTAESIPEETPRLFALAAVMLMAVDAGHLDRAETISRGFAHPRLREESLIALVEPLAAAGEHDHAETLARAAPDPAGRAAAFIALAAHVPPMRARALVGYVLRTGVWTGVIELLADVDPTALAGLADEVADGIRADDAPTH